ncbi:MAG: hypothetical protein BGO98_03545 [Myxococcales bacterium 68-20]|nr:hypothetical protein [Myxococcales bacterium]OJY25214.1 MAG: hypothetical protein BGO98_03545 [Myxococcales bacterium 68-20]
MSRDPQHPDAPTIGAASDEEFLRAIQRAERGALPTEAEMREIAERIRPLSRSSAARVLDWRLAVLAASSILVVGAVALPWRASETTLIAAPAVVAAEAPPSEVHAPPPPVEPAAAAPVVSVDALPTANAPPLPRAALAEPTCPGEIELVEAIDAALRAGDAAGALDRARQLEARCKNGRFFQERERLAIEALARLGRSDEVQLRARAFEQRFPSSPHVWRIRSLAEGDSR